MPRAGPPKAHRVPAAAAAQAQERPHQHHLRPQKQTENSTTANRNKLTRFKSGFEWETECELAQAFRRPPRLFKEDTPFYPWLPKCVPLVNFHLNFKGLGRHCSLSGVCLYKFTPQKNCKNKKKKK